MWAESGDPQVALLKKQKAHLDSQLANSQNANIQLSTELAELRTAHKEDIYRVGAVLLLPGEQELTLASSLSFHRKQTEPLGLRRP